MTMNSNESNTYRYTEINRDNNIIQFLQRENEIKHEGYIDRIKTKQKYAHLIT